jgi:hypothetical protein
MAHEEFRQHGDTEKYLAHVIEEAGEVVAAAGKTLRFGLQSVNPLIPVEDQITNEEWLRGEVSDLKLAIGHLETSLGW